MIATLLLAQILAAAPATTATPVAKANTGQTRTLADVARERKLGKRPDGAGALSVSGQSTPDSSSAAIGNIKTQTADTDAASEATQRMGNAIKDATWTIKNIHYNGTIKEKALRELDDSAENCRKTPGCKPFYRDSMPEVGRVLGEASSLKVYEKQINNGDAPLPARDRE